MHSSAWLDKLFACIDAMDTAGFLGFLTPNARFRFGSAPPVEGRAAIGRAVAGFFATIDEVHHQLLNVWPQGDVLICQGEVTYTRKDKTRVTLPFVDILRMKGEYIEEYSIYADITPLHSRAPAA